MGSQLRDLKNKPSYIHSLNHKGKDKIHQGQLRLTHEFSEVGINLLLLSVAFQLGKSGISCRPKLFLYLLSKRIKVLQGPVAQSLVTANRWLRGIKA